MFTIFFSSSHNMATNVACWQMLSKQAESCARRSQKKEIDDFRAPDKKITEYFRNVLARWKSLYYNKTVAERNREL